MIFRVLAGLDFMHIINYFQVIWFEAICLHFALLSYKYKELSYIKI